MSKEEQKPFLKDSASKKNNYQAISAHTQAQDQDQSMSTDGGRTNTGYSDSDFRESYSSVENKSEETLTKKCISMGLTSGISTPRTENCFFEAVSAQLKRPCFEKDKQMTARDLRKKVVEHLSQHQEFQSLDGPVQIDCFLSEPFESWCQKMSQDGMFADHVAAIGTALMLKTDIMIVTIYPNSNPEQTVTWIVGTPDFSGNPLLIGHCLENHYFSLEPTDRGCANPGQLASALHESYQTTENESEERLKKSCNSLRLKRSISTPKNGNCFFDAVSAQLRRLCLPQEMQMNASELRQKVVQHLSQNPELQLPEGPVQIDRLLSEPLQSWCQKMSQDGMFADHVVVIGTALMLKTDIMIVTIYPNSNPEQTVSRIVGTPDFSGNPLLIGHCLENHYFSLEPTFENNVFRILKEKRIPKIIENVMKDGGCINPSQLESALHESYQLMENESEERLKNNCNSIGLKFSIPTTRNGNCFFEAVSDQLKRLGLPQEMQMCASELRQNVVQHLSRSREFQSPNGPVQIDCFLSGTFESWCNRMSQEGVCADHVVAVGTAQMLKKDIVIVPSSPNNNLEQTVRWIPGTPNFSGTPVLLGHCWENHYLGLEPTDGGCTNPGQLESVLHDNYQDESEERLKNNCSSIGLKFSTATPRNGNCFFEAVSAQLKRLSLPKEVQMSASELRQKVVQHLSQNREFQSSNDPIKSESFKSDFELWLTKMSEDYVFADHVAVFGTAQMLKMDIVIVTTSPNSNSRQTVTWIVGDPNFSGDPLLLGHYWQNHYQSLEPTKQNNSNRQIPTKQRVYMMNNYAIKGGGCTSPGHLESILYDASVANESEKLLMENCNSLGLKVSNSTQRNGNCFFEAVSAQLKRLSLPQKMQMTASQLRQEVVKHLSKNQTFKSPYGPVDIEYFLSKPFQPWCKNTSQEGVFADHYCDTSKNTSPVGPVDIEYFLSEPFQFWCESMGQEGVFADHIVAVGTAQMLKMDIVIVTSSPNINPDQFVTWIVGEPNFSGDPLLLGHCWENHYLSLEPKENLNRDRMSTKDRVTEMRRNAIKEKNIRQISTRHRVYERISSAIKDVGCTNPGHLESILRDLSVLNESEKRLRQNCNSIGLKFGISTPRNGNCFFEAVSAQLKRLCLPQEMQMTASQLRQKVVGHLSQNQQFQSPVGPVDIEYFLSEPFQSWCESMGQEGIFADHIVAVGTAQMLKMDIVIVTSSPNINPDRFVTWIVGEPNFSGDPLLLGHCWENHYLSLEPKEKGRRGQISTEKLVSEMRRNVMKGSRRCSCNEEIRLDKEKIETLQEGDHITRPLQCCCGYIHLCFHHAILKEKIPENDHYDNGDVVFPFMGFSESNESKAEITSEKEILNYKKMYIYKIRYKYPKYEGEQVTRNVENLMGNDIQYHAFLNNCEHVCRGCVTGEEKSIQVDTLDKCCAQSVFGCLPRLIRLILAILSTFLDEFYPENSLWIIGIQAFVLVVYFYLILRQLINSQFRYDSAKMCDKCLGSSCRFFFLGFVFIIISTIGIIVDAVTNENCTTLALTLTAILFWFLAELCNVCSERCRRIATRCICCCTICTCCCCSDWCIAYCNTCCKCDRCFERCQIIMDKVDACCYCILNWCWLGLKCCCSCLKSGCSCVYIVLDLFFIYFHLPCCRAKISISH